MSTVFRRRMEQRIALVRHAQQQACCLQVGKQLCKSTTPFSYLCFSPALVFFLDLVGHRNGNQASHGRGLGYRSQRRGAIAGGKHARHARLEEGRRRLDLARQVDLEPELMGKRTVNLDLGSVQVGGQTSGARLVCRKHVAERGGGGGC